MRIIPYHSGPPTSVERPCCIRLLPGGRIPDRPAGVGLWLEGPDPQTLIRAASPDRIDTLNSLWLDPALWEACAPAIRRFSAVVLMPFDPAAPESPYDTNVERLLRLAEARGVPRDALVVDLCVLPYGRQPDTDVYRARAERLRSLGLRAVAGIDNLVYRERDKFGLMDRLIRALEDIAAFGLISAKYARWADERLAGVPNPNDTEGA